MFVTLSQDIYTKNAIEHLASLHPNERVITPKELINAPLELDGTLPTRITFIGHGSKTELAGADSVRFSTWLSFALRDYASNNPNILNSLTDIDLMACEIGHFDSLENSCFALDVARFVNKQLEGTGFNDIQIHAPTNLFSSQPDQYVSTEFARHKEEGYYIAGYKSEDDESHRSTLMKELDGHYKTLNQMKEFLNSYEETYGDEAGLEEKARKVSAQISIGKQIISNLENKLQNLQNLDENSSESENNLTEEADNIQKKLLVANNQVAQLEEMSGEIDHHRDIKTKCDTSSVRNNITRVTQGIESCYIRIHSVENDPRTILDKDPCNFTTLAKSMATISAPEIIAKTPAK